CSSCTSRARSTPGPPPSTGRSPRCPRSATATSPSTPTPDGCSRSGCCSAAWSTCWCSTQSENSRPASESKVMSLWVLLSGVVYMLVLLPFFVIQYLVTPWLDHRRATRTDRKVAPTVSDHVLLVGSDAVTQAFAARAERSGIPAVMVLEDAMKAGELHDQGRQVVVGPLD